MPQITQETIQGLLVWYLVFLFSTTFHEFAHAFLALKGGDLTAYETGHVTLDPTPHIRRSPWGMVLIPVLSYVQLGWMMGYASVPYNAEWGRKNPLRQALMSLAGPTANLLLALIAFGLMRGLLAAHVFEYVTDVTSGHYVQVAGGSTARSPLSALALALGVMFKLNVILCVFNLIPIPPLDGSGVLSGLFPDSLGNLYDRMNEMPAFSILGMVMAWQVAPYIVSPVWGTALRLLYR